MERNSTGGLLNCKDDFSVRLEKEIKDRFKSIRQFSLASGIPASSLAQYLKGTSEPTRPVLCVMANTLNISLEQLITGQKPSGSALSSELAVLASAINRDDLRLAIATVEESLVAINKTMPFDQKAELVLAVYDLFTSKEKVDPGQIIRLIAKIA